jgi:hypothetical protein
MDSDDFDKVALKPDNFPRYILMSLVVKMIMKRRKTTIKEAKINSL